MPNDIVLCTCFKCKKNGDNIGKYVHPTTKWRHMKNEKSKYNPDVESNRLVNQEVDLFNNNCYLN